MHENQGNSVIYYAHYTEGGVNKTGLTVTIDVYEVIRDGTATLVVNDGACTEIGAGLYRYLLASASVDAAAEYIGVFHTATATVDAQDIPAMWVIDRAGTEKLDNGVALTDAGVDAILDEVVVGSYTMRQLLKVMAAALAGKLSGGGTATLTFRGVDDASDVIVTTVDANKNRTNVTLTV